MGGAPSKTYHNSVDPSLDDKTVIVTGATSGIGKETARALLQRGAHLIAPARNKAKAERVYEELKASVKDKNPDPQITYIFLDLDHISSARAAAQAVADLGVKVSILVNNAGLGMQGHAVSEEGYERVMAVNHLNTAAWTWKLIELDVFEENARIVGLTSDGYSGANVELDWEWFKTPTPDRNKNLGGQMAVYSDTKWANMLFAYMLSKKWTNGTSYAVHPGFVGTEFMADRSGTSWLLYKVMGWFGSTPAQGSETSLFAALHPGIEEKYNGQYFTPSSVKKGRSEPLRGKFAAAVDKEGERLWATTLEMTRSTDPFA